MTNLTRTKAPNSYDICHLWLDRHFKTDQFQLEMNKVFMREVRDQQMERKQLDRMHDAATKIQRAVRTYQMRKQFLSQRRSAVVIQAWVRRHQARKRLHSKHNVEKVVIEAVPDLERKAPADLDHNAFTSTYSKESSNETEVTNKMGLSRSRLNERYRSEYKLKASYNSLLVQRQESHRYSSKQNLKVGVRTTASKSASDSNERLAKSSGISDKNETMSPSSHIRVRAPSQSSNVDQYLDDLFMPILDGDTDEFSDARSLAASIKGGFPSMGPSSLSSSAGHNNVMEEATLQQNLSRAFLQSAVAQNLQIQQQLMVQYQAFQQLLQTGHSRVDVHGELDVLHIDEHSSLLATNSSRGYHDTSLDVASSDTSRLDDLGSPTQPNDGKHSLLQFALNHFRQIPENLRSNNVRKSKKRNKNKKLKDRPDTSAGFDWTWKEQVDLVKFTKSPIQASLLQLDSNDLNKLALECFLSIMNYMGDYPFAKGQSEVDSVYTILMNCHRYKVLRDETYCQIMKQTTNNRSSCPDSCQRGWRLFSITAAYFSCSEVLKPYLFKYLEAVAYDKRRAYHGSAMVCLQNLHKTLRYGGRKNVPSIEEIIAISAGRNTKRQMYRLPGGTERVINTKSTSVVQDIIKEICGLINVRSEEEMEEYSLYCIVEGDTFTMPLAREEYILDVTTELQKNQQMYYLIFCRSVWHYPMRLDNTLYIEIVFNQIAPDYLEGLLLVMPGEQISQDCVNDIAKVAALLHRAADLDHMPTMKETKYLLPKPVLSVHDIKPPQWVNLVQSSWKEVEHFKSSQAKAQVLEILEKWSLFGSSFFAVRRDADPLERSEHILALNRNGVHFLDVLTHETLMHYPYFEVISTRKVKSEEGLLFLDMKCGNWVQQHVIRIQTDQAHEISRLIRQYITIQQRIHQPNVKKESILALH